VERKERKGSGISKVEGSVCVKYVCVVIVLWSNKKFVKKKVEGTGNDRGK